MSDGEIAPTPGGHPGAEAREQKENSYSVAFSAIDNQRPFGAHAFQSWEKGYPPLPVDPGTKRVLIPEWTKCPIDEGQVSRWRAQFPSHSLGIRLGTTAAGVKLAALDIDVLDEGIAKAIHDKFGEFTGVVPTRYGQGNKFLVPIRTAEVWRKRSSAAYRNTLRGIDPDAPKQRVECLAQGQQFVALGVHPKTGRPYFWEHGSPLDTSAEALPLLTQAQVDEIFELFERLAEEAGDLEQVGTRTGGGVAGERYDAPVEEVEVDKETLKDLKSALMHLAEHHVHDDYDDWITIGHALRQLGEPGFRLWEAWSEASSNFGGYDECREKWEGFRPSSTGYPAVFKKAQELGWMNPGRCRGAAEVFEVLNGLVLDRKNPGASADIYLARECTADDGHRTFLRHRGGFYQWNGACYEGRFEEEVEADIRAFLEPAKTQTKDGLMPFSPTRYTVAEVGAAIRDKTILPSSLEPPCWLPGHEGHDPREVVTCANGLLHLPTRRLEPPTPAYFNTVAVPFGYDPKTPPPKRWFDFLEEVWGADRESIQAIQEVAGYLLTADTSQQKAFLIEGPKRSGKGTIADTFAELCGRRNVAAPTLNSLSTNFGLQPLIGKSLAIISDARLGGRSDQATIAERLLSVSGEDTITIDRKFAEPWTGRLQTRFLILTNELPRIQDASGALANRFIVLRMTRSFFGQEDTHLKDKLRRELPGILNWAIEGWRRLNERGHFAQPASSAAAMQELEDLGSPVTAFVREHCIVSPEQEIPVQALYERYRLSCNETGKRPLPKEIFCRDLTAAVPEIRKVQHRHSGGRERFYAGIGLRQGQDDGRFLPPGRGGVTGGTGYTGGF